MPESKQDRLRRMALETIEGKRKQGFFLPYRYADGVKAPGSYPAIEAVFDRHRDQFQSVLDEIDARASVLEAFAGPPPKPRWDQDWFPRADGAAAYAMVASRRPRKVIEVGSGHSTRFMAAAASSGAGITCIDPEPRADFGDLAVDWRRSVLSEAHLPMFEALEPGDFAFFDSSHLMMPGTDVDMIFNRILPALRRGVIVHIHDILLPDPYPDVWEWRGYNEQNCLGGWILAGGLKPLFSSRYAVTRMGAAEAGVLSRLPLNSGAVETSFWVEKS